MISSMGGWRRIADISVLAAATLGLHVALAIQSGNVANGGLQDTDAYMRLIRVQELWQSGDWYQTLTSSLGAPGKLSLHWTRPLDVLILLPALLLQLFGFKIETAIYWSGVAISPMLQFVAAIAAARAARLLWPEHDAWRVAALMILLNGAAMTYCMPARPDHHSLGLLLATLCAGQALRATLNPEDRASALKAGAWAGVGVWVSPESLITIGPALVAFGLLWLTSAIEPSKWARQGRTFSLGMAAVILLAIALEQPPARWLQAEYDKVSILYLAIAATAAGDFWLAERMTWSAPKRSTAAAFLAGLSALLLAILFPQFYLGPLGNVSSPEAKDFLDNIREMSPILPISRETTNQFAGMVGNSLVALFVVPYCLLKWRKQKRWPAALLLSLTYLTALAATLAHQRIAVFLAPYGAILGCGLIAILCSRAQNMKPVTRLTVRFFAAFVAVFGAQLWFLVVKSDTANSVENTGCNPKFVAQWLNAEHPGIAVPDPLGAERHSPIIMTESINYTPELAYRTPYRFVGGPYHRGISDISDMYHVAVSTDDSTAREVIERRQVDYLLICTTAVPKLIGESAADSLYHRLLKGDVPGWLRPLPMSAEANREFRLFAVQH